MSVTKLKLITLTNEIRMVDDLVDQTVVLIHSTHLIDAIKKLIDAHDILLLNVKIYQDFEDFEFPPWDVSTFNDLYKIQRELVVYHKPDFKPPILVDKYSLKIKSLLSAVRHRLGRG